MLGGRILRPSRLVGDGNRSAEVIDGHEDAAFPGAASKDEHQPAR